jgi:hypothetical protein
MNNTEDTVIKDMMGNDISSVNFLKFVKYTLLHTIKRNTAE